jgi:hypothetical protein
MEPADVVCRLTPTFFWLSSVSKLCSGIRDSETNMLPDDSDEFNFITCGKNSFLFRGFEDS